MDREYFEEVAKRMMMVFDGLSDIHLTSIVKRLEMENNCRVFMRPFPTEAPAGNTPGCLFTCETSIILDKGEYPLRNYELLPSRDHFIFYRVVDGDAEAVRWAVGHEVGHIAFHWPLQDRAERLIPTQTSEGDLDGYMIEYLEKEEREANAFACIVASHHPRPTGRKNTIVIDDEFIAKVNEYRRRGYMD